MDAACIRDEGHSGDEGENGVFVLHRPIGCLLRVIWAVEVNDIGILLF